MQVPLEFEFQSNQTFESFFPGNNNVEIIQQLQEMANQGAEQQIYIWGEPGSGKSHLLQACCQLAKTLGNDPLYLALGKNNLPKPAMLDGLEELDLVCLDDVQHVAENLEWQQALFNFYNRHRQKNHHLIFYLYLLIYY